MEQTNPQPAPIPAEPVVLSYSGTDLPTERPIFPVGERVLHFVSTIALPIVCFGFSYEGYPAAVDWQNGAWYAKLSLIPGVGVGWPFFPLLGIAMYAAGCMIFAPRRAIASLNVRAGLITGILLAYQFSYLQVISVMKAADPIGGSLAGLIVPLVFIAVMLLMRWTTELAVWNRRWYRGRGRTYLWIGLAVVGAAAIALAGPVRSMRSVLSVTLIFLLAFAPGLTLASFTAIYLTARRRGGAVRGSHAALVAWLLGWPAALAAAWLESYHKAVIAYAKLPTTNPSCYIATAATRGHRRFVRRRVVDGVALTPQLAMLKAGELAIAARRPRLHRALRRVYDLLGPRLAGRIRHPLIADLVYASLKPVEWATAMCLGRRRS